MLGRTLKALGMLGIILSVLALVGSFPVENSFASRAVLAQRLEKDEAAGLFDDSAAFRKIGSPQKLIIDDPKAFVEAPGVDAEEGVKFVSEDYLKEKGIYPLQLRTVEFIAGNARIGSAIGLLLSIALLVIGRRKLA